MTSGKVILEGLEFHAYHGIYPYEHSSGNKFDVDVVIDTRFHESAFQDDLSGTIDYEVVYAIVKGEMEKPSKLLESVSHRIAEKLLLEFKDAVGVTVKVSKFNPPIGGVCRRSTVVVEKLR
jgi:7,8-dihydroneopterin aldolase/epimerase/oxygenase